MTDAAVTARPLISPRDMAAARRLLTRLARVEGESGVPEVRWRTTVTVTVTVATSVSHITSPIERVGESPRVDSGRHLACSSPATPACAAPTSRMTDTAVTAKPSIPASGYACGSRAQIAGRARPGCPKSTYCFAVAPQVRTPMRREKSLASMHASRPQIRRWRAIAAPAVRPYAETPRASSRSPRIFSDGGGRRS